MRLQIPVRKHLRSVGTLASLVGIHAHARGFRIQDMLPCVYVLLGASGMRCGKVPWRVRFRILSTQSRSSVVSANNRSANCRDGLPRANVQLKTQQVMMCVSL